MTHGGSRNRAGRKPGPKSEKSPRAAFRLTALPSEGYAGPIPDFPLPDPSQRELDVWQWAWRTPQACAWSVLGESWRIRTVAMWARVSVRCEDPEAPASLLAQVHRFSDQIGLTTAGLAEMGWKVAEDEVAAKAPTVVRASTPRRLRVAADGGN